ncbi:MAG: hypothetical protein EOP10_02695 [Proteobacteria bacterium]|nr:MAG: hypothetical protein EOP10_02695 [Pseudomonadota bacterium]
MLKILIAFVLFIAPPCFGAGHEQDVLSKTDVRQNAPRFAALFYFTGFGDSLYAGNSMAPGGDVWVMGNQNPANGPPGSLNFWSVPFWSEMNSEPNVSESYRFYKKGYPDQPNESLLNWHAQLLVDAGIDLIVIDLTNGLSDYVDGPSYLTGTRALLSAWQARSAKGLKTPQVTFFVRNEETLIDVENEYFKVFDQSLFFEYLGKKLLLVAQPDSTLALNDQAQPSIPVLGRFANYTARHCWGLDNSGTYWQFKTNSTTPVPPFEFQGHAEQLSAAVAVQSTYMTMDGKVAYNDARGRSGGKYFIQQMDTAIKLRPTFVFIHSWNEWTAINLGSSEIPNFVDQWMAEYSSDIEPMAGGHGWFYYDLLKQKVQEFKTAQ